MSLSRMSRCTLPFVLLCLGALAPFSAFALSCTTQGSAETLLHGDLGASLAIPATLPDGALLWRSEAVERRVECVRDNAERGVEDIVLMLNPDNRSLGQGIRSGITFQGVDHRQQNGRIATGWRMPACTANDLCPPISFDLRFEVFIEKYGVIPYAGRVSQLSHYRLFQLDSGLGPNSLRNANLSYELGNLAGLRFVGCDAQLQVIPETIDFGKVPMDKVRVGAVAASQPFSLLSRRACDSTFSVSARLQPVTGVVSDDLLVPVGNQSVGIRISHLDDGQAVPFNRAFHLADLLSGTPSALSRFNAELLWRTERPVPGPFAAELLIDLFYK